MTDYMLEIARDKGIRTVNASVLMKNLKMINMLKRRGFTLKVEDGNAAYCAELDLKCAMPFVKELPF